MVRGTTVVTDLIAPKPCPWCKLCPVLTQGRDEWLLSHKPRDVDRSASCFLPNFIERGADPVELVKRWNGPLP